MTVSSTLQKTVVNIAKRETVGYSIGKVCLPTSLSPITSLKSCACEVVKNMPIPQPIESIVSGVMILLSPIKKGSLIYVFSVFENGEGDEGR